MQGAGQAHFKPAGQDAFPANPNEMKPSMTVPLMIEAQFYEEDPSEFRLSVRAPPSENLVIGLVQLLELFMYPKKM